MTSPMDSSMLQFRFLAIDSFRGNSKLGSDEVHVNARSIKILLKVCRICAWKVSSGLTITSPASGSSCKIIIWAHHASAWCKNSAFSVYDFLSSQSSSLRVPVPPWLEWQGFWYPWKHEDSPFPPEFYQASPQQLRTTFLLTLWQIVSMPRTMTTKTPRRTRMASQMSSE